ncbi:cytochrome P450 [Hypoxylon cercidicola]|nr:cytochrome P450 [Hypoxylon cercidicola]
MLLLRQIRATGSSLNITTPFHHFAFDVMGEIAFGHSFSLIGDSTPGGDQAHIPALVSQGISMLRYFTPVPWVCQLCFSIAPYVPFISQKWNKGMEWAAMMCDTRLARDTTPENTGEANGQQPQVDAFSRFIVSARRDQDSKSLDRLALYGDAYVIIVAGSHTTAGTLTMMSFELARRPHLQAELRDEIMKSAAMIADGSGGSTFSETGAAEALEKLPFLNACINETLRLYPQVPTGGIRQTTEKGIFIGETFIPPQTVIVAPRWSIGRLKSAFVRPNEFAPERWTTKPDMVKDARAFNAFGAGRHMCPGKQFGMMEVRMAIAIIVSNFEFGISSSGKRENQALDDFVDAFTAFPGDLELVFKPTTM